MTIRQLQKEALDNARLHGFHQDNQSVGELLMLIVSELSEALEADRKNNHCDINIEKWLPVGPMDTTDFEFHIKDTFEDELADVVIRVADMAGYLGFDLESHIEAKMLYNKNRSHKHGKLY